MINHIDGNQKETIKNIRMCDNTKLKIKEAAQRVAGSPYKNILEFRANAAKEIVPILSESTKQALKDLSDHKGAVAINISNLPTGQENMPTPPDGIIPADKKDFISEAVLSALCDVVGGKMATQTNEHSGKSIKKLQREPIEQIVPNDKITNIQSGFSMPEFIHVEDSNKAKVPDVLAVITLKDDKNAKTVVLPATKIINDLNKDVVDVLRKPDFKFTPEEGETGEETIGSVLYKNKHGEDSIRFHTEFSAVKGLNPNAEKAVMVLRAYLSNKDNVPTINHQSGEVFLSDNHRALHGTYPFKQSEGKQGDNGRWLQRAYLTKLDKN